MKCQNKTPKEMRVFFSEDGLNLLVTGKDQDVSIVLSPAEGEWLEDQLRRARLAPNILFAGQVS